MYYPCLLISLLTTVVKAGYFTSLCEPTYIDVTRLGYNVTDQDHTVYSHDNYDSQYSYESSHIRCMDIWTYNTDHVIKLDEEGFHLEGYGCIYDYLEIYYDSIDDASLGTEEGTWCDTDGPGTMYSSGSHMFLYFTTDSSDEERGFKFQVSTIHKDDIPIQLSTGAIVGIVFGVLAVIIIIFVVVMCVLISKKKPGAVHPRSQPANRNAVMMSTMRPPQHRQPVGGFVRPPQYQQQPPPYQANYNTRPAVQPGSGPPPPRSQDPVYPPPEALYNPTAPPVQQAGGIAPYPDVPPPPYQPNA